MATEFTSALVVVGCLRARRRSSLEAAIPARSQPIRPGCQRDQPGLSGSCTRLRRPWRLRAVRRGCPRVSTLLCASVREAHPGPNRSQMAGYRGGIYADLAHERGHLRLFSRLPGGRPGATSGANRAEQQWFSPADTELRRTLQPRASIVVPEGVTCWSSRSSVSRSGEPRNRDTRPPGRPPRRGRIAPVICKPTTPRIAAAETTLTARHSWSDAPIVAHGSVDARAPRCSTGQ